MPDGSERHAFRDRIVDSFDSLPPQQRLVAEWCLEHGAEIPFLSVPEVARRCGASEATVVRFSQGIGYDGFGGLKADLLEAFRQRMHEGRETDGPDLPTADDDTLSAVARHEIANVERTLLDIDRGAFRAAASAIFRADHLYTFGLGISAHLSSTMAYLLTQIGLRATRLPTDSSSPLEACATLRPSDLLIAFSFPPYSVRTVEIVRDAARRGLPTRAPTPRPTAPPATRARWALPVRSDNLMFTNSFAAVSVVLNALITEIALRNREHTVEAVSRINRILESERDLLGGGSS
jgi:DNA-binding MurR/RpiR family transcriptional regulator